MTDIRRFATSAESNAYKFAVRLGFSGTEQDWADSLKPCPDPPQLDDSSDFASLPPGVYSITDDSITEAFGLPSPAPGLLDKLPTTISSRIYRFRPVSPIGIQGIVQQSSGALWMALSEKKAGPPGPWHLIDSTDDDRTASQQIKDLARLDGWAAVYDPTDPTTAEVDENLRVVRIADGLGNYGDLENHHGSPRLLEREYGQFNGIEGGSGILAVDFAPHGNLPQPNTVMMFGRVSTTTAGQRFLLDGVGKRRHSLHTRNEPGSPLNIWAGWQSPGGDPIDTEPHLFTATYDGDRTQLTIDSRFYRGDSDTRNNQQMGGLTVGGDTRGQRQWRGSAGPILVYHGKIPADVRARMESLLYSLSGLQASRPRFTPQAIVYSTDESGHATVTHGEVDTVHQDWGIASLTKLMMAWVARQVLTTDRLLDEKVTITTEDRHRYSYRRFRVGDVASYRDLIRAALAASDNTAPYAIARGVGQRLPGYGDTVSRFVQAMNAAAASLGYTGASFTAPWNHGRMSAAQIEDLHRRILTDDFLVDALGMLSRDISIGGGRSRTMKVQHRVVISPIAPLTEMVTAKTGTWPPNGRGHVTLAWKHPDGSTHVTVILNVGPKDERYEELQKVITAVKSRTGSA